MNRTRPNPFVFVVGCPRSGTTLLQRMLDSHGLLAVANDTNFIHKSLKAVLPDWHDYVKKGIDPPLTPQLVEHVLTYKRVVRLGLPAAGLERAARCRTWSQFTSALYDALAESRGKPHAGEKTPDYVRRIPFLHGLFPSTPVVHIIRDGRDVALSLREWAAGGKGPGRFEIWGAEPVATSALWWCWQVATGRREGRQLGDRLYLEVRYEDLVKDAEPVLRRLCEFIGLPFDDAMLRFHEGKASYERSSAKSAWLPATPGLRDWRAQMPSRELQSFEALAGEMLDELGYERGAKVIDDDVLATTAKCRRWWHSSSGKE